MDNTILLKKLKDFCDKEGITLKPVTGTNSKSKWKVSLVNRILKILGVTLVPDIAIGSKPLPPAPVKKHNKKGK